jgi:hypothetical protein
MSSKQRPPRAFNPRRAIAKRPVGDGVGVQSCGLSSDDCKAVRATAIVRSDQVVT